MLLYQKMMFSVIKDFPSKYGTMRSFLIIFIYKIFVNKVLFLKFLNLFDRILNTPLWQVINLTL